MTNIELPRDAEGREIPLDTKALYGNDGEGLDVRHFEFSPFSGKWIIAALKLPMKKEAKLPKPSEAWRK